MRERNRLLERSPQEAAWLDGVEEQMAEVAVAVAAARLQAFEALEGAMGHDEEGCFPWAELRLEGELEGRLTTLSAVEVEDQYRTMLRDSRRIDAGAGRTLNGPHRSDLLVTHGPKGVAARDCSTGEQKALLVSTILAHVRLIKSLDGGAAPVLLLDEIAAHLDAERRAALFGILQDLGGQVWMTGPTLSCSTRCRAWAEFFSVEDGRSARFELHMKAMVYG